jgi:hypothetical protein
MTQAWTGTEAAWSRRERRERPRRVTTGVRGREQRGAVARRAEGERALRRANKFAATTSHCPPPRTPQTKAPATMHGAFFVQPCRGAPTRRGRSCRRRPGEGRHCGLIAANSFAGGSRLCLHGRSLARLGTRLTGLCRGAPPRRGTSRRRRPTSRFRCRDFNRRERMPASSPIFDAVSPVAGSSMPDRRIFIPDLIRIFIARSSLLDAAFIVGLSNRRRGLRSGARVGTASVPPDEAHRKKSLACS